MKQVNFESDEVVLASDLSAIGEEMIQNFREAVEAVASGDSKLMKNQAPLAVEGTGGLLDISWTDMYFLTNGYVGKLPTGTRSLTIPGYDAQIGLYLRVQEVSVTGTRDKLQPSGSTYTRTPVAGVVVEKELQVDLVTVITANSTTSPTPPAPPVTGGLIEWAIITVTPGGAPPPYFNTISVALNTSDLWQFPGATIAYSPHAASHVTGGTDAIATALWVAFGSGSNRDGLMPAWAQAAAANALQGILTTGANPFSITYLNPDNITDPILQPRSIVLRLNIDSTLKITSGNLGVDLAGTGSSQAARADHVHNNISTLPFDDFGGYWDVLPSDLGTYKSVTVPGGGASVSVVYGAKMYWAPPGTSMYKVECGWIKEAAYSVGGKVVKGTSELDLNFFFGEYGFVYLDTALLDYIKSAVGGVTWTFNGSANFPTSGRIYYEALKRGIA